AFDAGKHRALPLVADARVGLELLSAGLGAWRSPRGWVETATAAKTRWLAAAKAVTDPTNQLPSDAQVIGAVARARGSGVTLVCASGGLPGELHKLWPAGAPGSYHMEYGYSTMGYEIAGGLGVKLAKPDHDVVVMLGDGSYMMMNSEIATSVMLGRKLTIVVLDNRGFGCINRLQMATGGANFNNLLKDTQHEVLPEIDFAQHAAAMGAWSRKVSSVGELETALGEAASIERTTVLVIDTDPLISTEAGGHWWDVAVPEVSVRPTVNAARREYEEALKGQRL
uniref:thiamine pyrophosphate-dependent enzyme n=1 Tax=Devosia sp. TaxID=1871048 RepID=UPI0035B0C76C